MISCAASEQARAKPRAISAMQFAGARSQRYDCFSFAARQIPRRRTMPVEVSLVVNGKTASAQIEARTLLVDFIRNNLSLTGTHVGCDTGQCGACTVLVDGNAVKACTILAVQANGSKITSIEGLAKNGELHPMQAAFKDCHGLQCGFCTPGMVLSAIDLVQRHPDADEATIRAELEGNLCPCTGYHNIVKAVAQGAAAMKG